MSKFVRRQFVAAAVIFPLLVASVISVAPNVAGASQVAPTFVAGATNATDVMTSTATLGTQVNPNGGSTSVTFCYSTTFFSGSGTACPSGTRTLSAVQGASSATNPVSFTASATGLSANTQYFYAALATQGSSAVWSSTVDFMPTTAGPFGCTSTIYQIIGGQLYSFGFNPSTASFSYTPIGAAGTAINAIGYNDVNNYIYGWNGSVLTQVDSNGVQHTLGTFAHVYNTGGDFFPHTSIMLTVSGSSFAVNDVSSGSLNSQVLTTTAGSASWNANDVTLNVVGNYYVGYGMAGNTIYQISIPKSAIPLNSAKWTSTTFNGVATVRSVTGVSSAVSPPGSSDPSGSAMSDAAGDMFFYDNSLVKIYELPVATLSTMFPSPGVAVAGSYGSALQLLGAPSNSVSGTNDGAGCVDAGSSFAPAATTIAASSLQPTSVTLNGTVGANGSALTNSFFIYSTSPATTNGQLTGTSVAATNSPSLGSSISQIYTTSANLTGLAPGTTYYYQALGTNAGGTNNGSVLSFTTPKAPTVTTITSTSSPTVGGQDTIAVHVAPASGSGTPTGTVTVTDGTNSCTVTLDIDGNGSCDLSEPSAGSLSLTATYTGDTQYLTSSGTGSDVVVAAAGGATTTAITSTSSPTAGGQDVVAVTVVPVSGSGTPTGTVSISDGTSQCTATLDSNGNGQCSLPEAVAGSISLTATYSGDSSYNPSVGTGGDTIGQVPTTTTITSTSSPSAGGAELVAVQVAATTGSGVPTGTVTISDGTTTCTATLDSSGNGSCSLSEAAAGPLSLTATYNGDTNDVTSTGTGSDVVAQTPTTTSITAVSSPVVGGQDLISVVVVANTGNGVPTGTVTISDGTTSCTATLDSNGNASCSLTELAAATLSLTATYNGDANYTTSTGTGSDTVGLVPTTTTILGGSTPSAGSTDTVTVNVTATNGAGYPSGTVTISDGVNSCTATLDARGNGSCSLPEAAAGSVALTATYNGDSTYDTSVGTGSDTVSPTGTTTSITGTSSPTLGDPEVVSVTVVPNTGNGVPTGTVTISDSQTSCTATLDSNGNGSCSLAEAVAGPLQLTATYNGDANYTGSVGSGSDTVAQAPTVPNFTTSTGPQVGSPVTVYVTVVPTNGSGIPSGSVLVSDGTDSCTVTLDSSGAGSCDLPAVAAGPMAITASYAGDVNYLASASTASTTVAQGPTTTSITGTSSPTAGANDTVSVTVAAVNGSGVPTGTVTISDGTNSCTATLDSNGNGSCDLPENAAGSINLTATYNGDADYIGSVGTGSDTISAATSLLPQTVAFTTTPSAPTVGGAYTPTAPSSAPLTTSITSSTPSVCTISNGVVTFVGTGTCTLVAAQPGDSTYAPATSVQQSFTVGATVTHTAIAPSVPRNVKAAFSDATGATLTWRTPANMGSSPLIHYIVIIQPGHIVCTTTTTTCSVSGLKADVVYTFTVEAVTAAGTSPLGYALGVILVPYVNNSPELTATMVKVLSAFASKFAAYHLHSVVSSGYASQTGTVRLNHWLGTVRASNASYCLGSDLLKAGYTHVTLTSLGFGATNFAVADTTAAQNRRTTVTAS